ncbi:MAG: cell wall hydrolase [Sphingomonadales bacterium]|nr:cell wall hydrolase [Sphingomonadales bacterium]
MSNNLRKASLISVAATVLITIFSAASSGAAAEGATSRTPAAAPAELSPDQLSQAVPGFGTAVDTQPLPTELSGESAPAPVPAVAPQPTAESLSALVAAQTVSEEISPELKCLASAIYYEARSEPLSGQLAVGRVIVNRSRSGRFPNSYCGVVYQPSQFSFVHGSRGGMNQRLWHNAVAVAQIANDGSWQSEAEGALYFHAARVAPAWHLHKVAQIENHVFYR